MTKKVERVDVGEAARRVVSVVFGLSQSFSAYGAEERTVKCTTHLIFLLSIADGSESQSDKWTEGIAIRALVGEPDIRTRLANVQIEGLSSKSPPNGFPISLCWLFGCLVRIYTCRQKQGYYIIFPLMSTEQEPSSSPWTVRSNDSEVRLHFSFF